MDKLTCKSCGHLFEGNFCNQCGEKVIRKEDRKLRYFLGELFNALTFADNKLFRTLKLMLLKPGQLSGNYVEGKRKAFMKPLGIFFLGNLIYFLFPFVNTFTTSLEIQTGNSFIYSEMAEKWTQEAVEERGIAYEEYEQMYNTKTAELSKLLLIVMALFLALFFAIIHLGSNKNLLADHLTMSLELMGFMLFYGIQMLYLVITLLIAVSPFNLQFLFSNFYLSLILILMLTYFFFGMERIFYKFGWVRSSINTLLCLSAVVVSLEMYRGLLFFITFWSM